MVSNFRYQIAVAIYTFILYKIIRIIKYLLNIFTKKYFKEMEISKNEKLLKILLFEMMHIKIMEWSSSYVKRFSNLKRKIWEIDSMKRGENYICLLITLRNVSFFFFRISFISFEHASIAIVINATINTCLLIYRAKKKMETVHADNSTRNSSLKKHLSL